MKTKQPKSDSLGSVRLQKFLAGAGVASRRKSEELILEGKVKVNGKVITELGTKVNPKKDQVYVGRKKVISEHKGLLLFHKPVGVISTKSDPQNRKTVMDYLSPKYKSYFPVGRLDYNSSGLMLMTNDGELADILMHPKHGLEKKYEVVVKYHVYQKKIDRMKKGIKLEDGLITAMVHDVQDLESNTKIRLSIKVGRKRVIRRMMKELGHPVVRLKRVAHGPFKLGSLKAGKILLLTDTQYKYYKNKLSE